MRKLFLALALSAVLLGCGGGGDEVQVSSTAVVSDEITKAGVVDSRPNIPAERFNNISPLPDGGYVVVRTLSPPGPASFNIQRHDSSGNKTGEIDLSDPRFAPNSTLTVLSNGDLLVSYAASRPFGPQSDRAALTKSAVYIQRFNSAGARREEEFEVISNVQSLRDSRSYYLHLDVRAAALPDGGFLLGWDDRLISVLGSQSTYYIQRFNEALERVSASVKIGGVPAGSGEFSNIRPLPDGGYVMVWTADPTGPAKFTIQRHDSSGNKTGEVNLIDPAFAFNSTLTVLSNGDLLVSYAANRPFGPQSDQTALRKSAVYIQRFNSAGARREEEFEVISSVQSRSDLRSEYLFMDVRAAALPDGGFLLGWDDRLIFGSVTPSTYDVRRFNKAFEPVGASGKIGGVRPS